MKKKLLAILLAAIMLMSLLPTVAFATEPTIIDEVSVSLAYDFDKKTMTFTPAAEDEGKYEVPEDFTIDAFDKDGNLLYEYGGPADGSDGEWCDGVEFDPIEETEVDMDKVSFLIYDCVLTIDNAYRWNTEGMVVNVNGEAFEKIVRDDNEVVTSTGYEPDSEYLRICIRQDLSAAPVNSDSANITGEITAADFAYKMVNPADTVLTEDDHKDVLLGDGGIVTIDVTKHGADNIDVFYTVDLSKGNLTDGETTITTTYGFSTDGEAFDALAAGTEYTVYTGGEEITTYVNVTADNASWNAAPVGDYNATLVFNFDKREVAEPTTVADIASEMGHLTINNDGHLYGFKYEENSLNLHDDNEQKEIIATLPGTTVLTASGDNWTCTVGDVTYLFNMSEGELASITVSGMSNTYANGEYTGGLK